MRLYLDSFVYDLIQRRGEAAQVRKWRKAHAHEIGFSVNANVVETALIRNRVEQVARFETIVRVGTAIQPPYDYLHYREIADTLWQQRPEWFRRAPDWRRAVIYLRKRKAEALKLKDPSLLPDFTQQQLRIQALIGRDIGRQKQHRQRLNRGIGWLPKHSRPEVQRCIDQRTAPDVFWRYANAEEARESLAAELRPSRHLEWMVDFGWPQPVADWHRFWMCDADAQRMPLCRIVGLTEFYQRQRKVTHGNSVDRLGHAPHMFGFDWFLSTDRRFFQSLQDVQAEMVGVKLARLALLDSEAPSALTAIVNAIT